MPSSYDIKKNPQHQRALSSLLARQSMGGGKRIGLQGRLNAQMAGQQFGRQLEFERLALRKKASDVRFSHEGRMMGLREKALKKEGKQMGLQTALGIGGMGLNYLEGKRRAGVMKADRKATADWREGYSRDNRRSNMLMERLLKRKGKPYDYTTDYTRGGMQQ